MVQDLIAYGIILGAVIYTIVHAIKFFVPRKHKNCNPYGGCSNCSLKKEFVVPKGTFMHTKRMHQI